MKKITVTDLSAEEKLRLICAQDFWHTVNFNGKIPQVTVSDGPVGLRKEIIEEGKTVTVPSVSYPSVQSLANSWRGRITVEIPGTCAMVLKYFEE